MTIELKPEQERILQEALREGRFHSMEEALERVIQSIAPQESLPRPNKRPTDKKSLTTRTIYRTLGSVLAFVRFSRR